ncbi:vegetative incompatibility het-e-1 [Trichoderma arundinaceum]|uniref:Vegetative incompatibility het-e-1 n=1 Tax=Trichoderma arundinaceum TaxID=490622 RepID=A0A395NTE5_TRIAR|nr:vegetative incompatibility het-e-1 [Trichoderma arundinaceum]
MEEDIRLLVHLLTRTQPFPGLQLKFFLTSRPELPIRLEFKLVEGEYHDLALHEILEIIIERDIYAFLEHTLAKIRGEYNLLAPEDQQLPLNWPSQPNIQSLAKMAIPLFIFAASVCRFLEDRKCGIPNEQLREVLLFQTKSQESQLDATYMPILNKLIAGLSSKQRDKVLQSFRDIVGPILILANPLSTSSLAQILNIPRHITILDWTCFIQS